MHESYHNKEHSHEKNHQPLRSGRGGISVSCHRRSPEPPDTARPPEVFPNSENNFSNPPAEFRTAPFWVWNGKVTKQDIDRNLEDFKSKGFGGVFIHPRYGLITEYLSQEWFDLVAYSCRKAEQLGLFVWIYDENSFPSGFGGGHVPAAMPESFNQGQGLEGRKAEDLNDETVKDAFCVLERSGSEFVEVTDPGSRFGTKGEYWIFRKTFYDKSKWYGGFLLRRSSGPGGHGKIHRCHHDRIRKIRRIAVRETGHGSLHGRAEHPAARPQARSSGRRTCSRRSGNAGDTT